MVELNINEKADKENIEIYKKMGCSKPFEYRHTCVLCGNKTNIFEAYSNRGRKMICKDCVMIFFGQILIDKLNKWLEED